jgi:hypothetical protein
MPVHGGLARRFAYSLLSITIDALTEGFEREGERVAPELKPFMAQSADNGYNRNVLTNEAIKWGADYLLFMDVDHFIPTHGLRRLLSLQREVVGVNYLTRGLNVNLPTAIKDGERLATTKAKAEAGLVEEVDSLGMGFCLVAGSVFWKMNEHALAQGRDNAWPIFHFEAVDGDMATLGEDRIFCRKCHEIGIPVYVDHALSAEVGHIDEAVRFFTA